MSDGIVYGVRVEFQSSGSISDGLGIPNATARVGDLSKQLSTVGTSFAGALGSAGSSAVNMLSSIGDTIVNGLTTVGVAAGAALAAGAMASLREGLKFDEFKENAINSLASIDSMMGSMTFDSGIVAAEGTFERLRVSAKKLPGELKDSMNFMTAIAPVTQNFGRERVESMSSNGVAAAMALGVSQQTAAREIVQREKRDATIRGD